MGNKKCGCGKEADFSICENGHVQKVYKDDDDICSRCESEVSHFLCLECAGKQEKAAEK